MLKISRILTAATDSEKISLAMSNLSSMESWKNIDYDIKYASENEVAFDVWGYLPDGQESPVMHFDLPACFEDGVPSLAIQFPPSLQGLEQNLLDAIIDRSNKERQTEFGY